jgi:hypothetical protein
MNMTLVSRQIRGLCLVLLLVCPSHTRLAAQGTPEELILQRAVAAIQTTEPEWTFTTAVCNCFELMKEDRGIAAGSWQKPSDESTLVLVRVDAISTAKAAARWLSRQSRPRARDGWTHRLYPMGDGATMDTYADPRGFTQFSLIVRKGRFLVTLSARSEETVRRFANVLLTAASN